jgi:hypothetical protein
MASSRSASAPTPHRLDRGREDRAQEWRRRLGHQQVLHQVVQEAQHLTVGRQRGVGRHHPAPPPPSTLSSIAQPRTSSTTPSPRSSSRLMEIWKWNPDYLISVFAET